MPAKSATFSNNLLKLIFNGVAIANIADNGTSPLANLYVSLHTSSPGINGDQTVNEAQYEGYNRAAVARNSGGWTVVSNVVSPANTIVFPVDTSGIETETYFAIGTAAYPATGELLYFEPINPSINVSPGVTPELTTASTVVES